MDLGKSNDYVHVKREKEGLMAENPCKDVYDEYKDAMVQWVQAANALQSFAATGPLDPLQDVKPIPYEDYKAASEKAEEAYKKYLEKLEVYFKCLEDHGLMKKPG